MRWPALLGALLLAGEGGAAAAAAGLQACRLPGVEHEALCGQLTRPLDPAAPQGVQIELHFAVLPALARNKRPDPVFVFAGGPGQSAIDAAGPLARRLARLSNRRDIVLVDQRGTGRSAPLACAPDKPLRPLRESVDHTRLLAELRACLGALQREPHGDLRQYTTTIAMADIDAVRQALGAPMINLFGVSYGSRAALEYMRQFPQAVRRAVLDGVVPPDMVLPASFSTDGQAAFDAVFAGCVQDAACNAKFPALRARWQQLLASLPREVVVAHPVSGVEERLTMTRDGLFALLRQPLYVPALASALPQAIDEAAAGRFAPLFGLASALGVGRRGSGIAQGMHFSVICAEDLPRLAASSDAPGRDFGDSFAQLYREVCADWPRGAVPAAFYTVPPAPAATLLLSGADDPATPPRHGERVALALGARARHVVVPNAGHGVTAIGCLGDALFRFIDAADDAAALRVDTGCAAALPRPPPFLPFAVEGVR